jgi:hypothetical protein
MLPEDCIRAVVIEEAPLEVHPPHGPIHTWRDFFVHLITITIGLLIALGLEALVEWFHHRHLVHEARSTIRLEMTHNRELLAEDLSGIGSDETRISADVQEFVKLRGGTRIERSALQYFGAWSSFPDSAWRTAQATGALNYMDYETTQALTEVYLQQRITSDRGIAVFDEQTRAIAPIFITGDPNLMSKDEIQLTLQRSADLLLDLKALEQLLKTLDAQLAEELQKEAPH